MFKHLVFDFPDNNSVLMLLLFIYILHIYIYILHIYIYIYIYLYKHICILRIVCNHEITQAMEFAEASF